MQEAVGFQTHAQELALTLDLERLQGPHRPAGLRHDPAKGDEIVLSEKRARRRQHQVVVDPPMDVMGEAPQHRGRCPAVQDQVLVDAREGIEARRKPLAGQRRFANADIRREIGVEREPQLSDRKLTLGTKRNDLSGRVHAAVGPPRRGDPDLFCLRRAGLRPFRSRPRRRAGVQGWNWKPLKSLPSYSTTSR